METHYVSLINNPHALTGQQADELKKITLETYEERFIKGVDKEIYFKGTYNDCEAFRSSVHVSLKNELITRDIPS